MCRQLTSHLAQSPPEPRRNIALQLHPGLCPVSCDACFVVGRPLPPPELAKIYHPYILSQIKGKYLLISQDKFVNYMLLLVVAEDQLSLSIASLYHSWHEALQHLTKRTLIYMQH